MRTFTHAHRTHTYAEVHIHTHTDPYTCVSTYVHTYVYTCTMCTSIVFPLIIPYITYVHTHTHVCPCIRPSIHPSIHSSMHPSVHASMPACTRACMHSHTRRTCMYARLHTCMLACCLNVARVEVGMESCQAEDRSKTEAARTASYPCRSQSCTCSCSTCLVLSFWLFLPGHRMPPGRFSQDRRPDVKRSNVQQHRLIRGERLLPANSHRAWIVLGLRLRWGRVGGLEPK